MKNLQNYKRKVLPVPVYVVKSVFTILFVTIAALTILDRFILPNLENQGIVVSHLWHSENAMRNRNNELKIKNQDYVWKSKGIQVGKKSVKPKRILVMGDSFVWGYGHTNVNDLWWRQLQRELNNRGYNEVEVIAAGTSGASTFEQFDALIENNLLDEYSVDAVIWGYVTNDPDQRMIPNFNYSLLDQKDNVLKILKTGIVSKLYPRLSNQLVSLREKKVVDHLQNDTNGYEYSRWELELLEGKNFQAFQKTIEKLAQFKQEISIPLFFITLPNSPSLDYFEPRYQKVSYLFKSFGIDFYNILYSFVEKYPNLAPEGNKLVWGINPADGHPGPISAHFFAVQAANILEKNYSEVLGRRSEKPTDYPLAINDWMPYSLNLHKKSLGVYTFDYPKVTDNMPYLPLKRYYVQLNLENPIKIKEIHLEGSNLESVNFDYTLVDTKLGYDNGNIYSMKLQKGNKLRWNPKHRNTATLVNTIRFSANFNSKNQSDRKLTLTILPSK